MFPFWELSVLPVLPPVLPVLPLVLPVLLLSVLPGLLSVLLSVLSGLLVPVGLLDSLDELSAESFGLLDPELP